jgi:tRNA pseudouridine55 synthase
MNGVLVADKPLGPSSHDVVARVRRAIRLRRIGHTGTLDPLATGVLPLVVGRATRLASLLSGTAKEYVAGVRLGAATPTYDAESRTIRDPATRAPVALAPPPPEPPGVTRETVDAALPRFRGTSWQVPPAYSAKKIDGVAAYKRARRNEPVAPRPVLVTVHAIELERYEAGLACIRLSTSAGFYVRSFAHELGQLLRCGAHLETLRRHRAGDFTLADAVPLETVEREGPDAVSHLIPLERLLLHLAGIVLTERGARRAGHGNGLTMDDLVPEQEVPTSLQRPASSFQPGSQVRLLDSSGALLGIADLREPGLLHPLIVLV